ncbi:MAG: BREX system P-loop protein BrxC, partial [Proteobacteria bacterium]|nr:BREX system P-loop protein BrxC [Pseudomonadota bacterium]
ENQRVKEMLDIVKETTGKEYVFFVIDEVGQYVAPRPNLILNLDGLAKNLKEIGGGKVWIIGTAQQTLTEDDERAAINSRELYKLKDRFPIQIDLEASDIKEICYRRLLGKSAEGEQQLGEVFAKGGQSLRNHTKLKDAKYYDSDLNKESFVKFYPFLPAHFEILLHLLGSLAKSTGGIGLRSAIKVVQDILIERSGNRIPLGEQSIGTLVTMVTIYDSLEKDIGRASIGIHGSVAKVLACYPDSVVHQEVAKTVAIMQILDNLPTTVHNVAALIQPNIEASSRREVVEKAVNELMGDSNVPFGEQEGNLRFFSEKLNDIEKERSQIPLRSVETRRIFNEALKEIFTPLPSARLDGSLAVKTGLKSQNGPYTTSLDGERETIQTVVELAEAEDYETARTRLVEESRPPVSKYVIYLLARSVSETEEKLAEIYRCREICHRYRNEPDQEVKDYCKSQSDRSGKLVQDLQRLLKQNLLKGSFIFRGQTTAINSLNPDLLESCKQYLGIVAAQVYDRYSEAPVRAETTLAEKFLKLENLTAATAKTDPLSLVTITSGKPAINIEHKALISIRDIIDRHGRLEGKRLIECFSAPPFGWSQDTLRYLVAALLLGGKIALNVSGREITVNGQQAIDALKTNNSFKPIGISFRGEGPGIEEMALAAERLKELIGEMVMPVEDQICKTAAKYLPRIQSRIAPLGEKLAGLGLPGSERVNTAMRDIAELLFADASDAPKRFGNKESALYEDLKWAGEVRNAF